MSDSDFTKSDHEFARSIRVQLVELPVVSEPRLPQWKLDLRENERKHTEGLLDEQITRTQELALDNHRLHAENAELRRQRLSLTISLVGFIVLTMFLGGALLNSVPLVTERTTLLEPAR